MSGSYDWRFEHDAFGPDVITHGVDDTYMKFNYDLCGAINMIRLAIVLERMVEHGTLNKRLAELYHSQAATLLALLRSENNRMIDVTRANPPADTKGMKDGPRG